MLWNFLLMFFHEFIYIFFVSESSTISSSSTTVFTTSTKFIGPYEVTQTKQNKPDNDNKHNKSDTAGWFNFGLIFAASILIIIITVLLIWLYRNKYSSIKRPRQRIVPTEDEVLYDIPMVEMSNGSSMNMSSRPPINLPNGDDLEYDYPTVESIRSGVGNQNLVANLSSRPPINVPNSDDVEYDYATVETIRSGTRLLSQSESRQENDEECSEYNDLYGSST
jgi:hypothetical protein